MEDSPEHDQTPTVSGSVLVAGCAFIVTGAAWGLFGFLEGEFADSPSAIVYFAFALAYGLLGIAILKRRGAAIPAGILLAAAGIIIALVDPQFVLVFTNAVILTLLILARGSIQNRGAG